MSRCLKRRLAIKWTISNASSKSLNIAKAFRGITINTSGTYNKIIGSFFGTGLTADFNEIKVKDMDETDLSGTVRMKVVFTGGVQYAYGGEIVLYRA